MNDRLVQLGGMWCPAGDPYFGPRLTSPAGALWEGATMQAAFDLVSDWRCAIDIGAHIGTWTRQFAARFDSVVAFEPDPLNFDALSQNLREVGNTRLLPLALARESGRYSLSRKGAINSGQGHLMPVQDDEFGVIGLPLDALDMDGVGLIKIDVEGLECDVLTGAEKTIRACRSVVVIEETAAAARYGRKPGDARRMLESWGAVEAKRIEFAPNNFDVIMQFGEPH